VPSHSSFINSNETGLASHRRGSLGYTAARHLARPQLQSICSAIFELAKRSPDASAAARKNWIEIQPMRQADIHLIGWEIAADMGELSVWLDRNQYVPQDFAISKLPNGDLLVRVEFGDDAMAEVFEREFAR